MDDQAPFLPKYRAIANEIRSAIAKGRYIPGEQLPSRAALMEQFGVALGTIERALGVLREDGLTETYHGKGTFIKASAVASDTTTDLADRVTRLEAQMLDVYANLGIKPAEVELPERRVS